MHKSTEHIKNSATTAIICHYSSYSLKSEMRLHSSLQFLLRYLQYGIGNALLRLSRVTFLGAA